MTPGVVLPDLAIEAIEATEAIVSYLALLSAYVSG
jgi:hypothetical protein